MGRPETWISDDQWYEMRRLRAKGESIESIMRQVGFSQRQVMKATEEITAGKVYSEEELRRRAADEETEPDGDGDGKGVVASPTDSEVSQGDEEKRLNPKPRVSEEQRRFPPKPKPFVRDYQELANATEIKPQVMLTMVGQAYEWSFNTVGEWLEADVLPWYRAVIKIREKFTNATRPGEEIEPEEFLKVLDNLLAQNVTFKDKYKDLESRVKGLLGGKKKRGAKRGNGGSTD